MNLILWNNIECNESNPEQKNLSFSKNGGPLKKTVFLLYLWRFLDYRHVTLEQYRTNIEPGTTEKILKIKKWGANFIQACKSLFSADVKSNLG